MTEVNSQRNPPLRSGFKIGEWRIQPDLNRISRQGQRHQIEPRLMDVLCDLAAHPRQVRSREDLLDAVWGADTFVSEEVLSRAISELRRLFEDSAQEPSFIETIRGRGYRLIADVAAPDLEPAVGPGGRRRWLLVALLVVISIAAGLYWRPDRAAKDGVARPLETVAVLPFNDFSEGKIESHFAFGVTEVLTTRLARLGAFHVISRTSAMRYRDSGLSVPEIAAELGADAIVEGSVVRDGSHLSLTVQLIDAHTDHHLWTEIYEGEIENILSLQQRVALEIGRELRGTQLDSTTATPRTLSTEAYDAYSRGRYLWQQGTRASLASSIDAFREALEADPAYAEAYAGLADTYILMALYELLPPDTAYREARRWTLEALALDPDLGEAHTALGAIRLFYEWDFARAEKSFNRAFELNPNHPITYLGYSDLMDVLYRPEEALAAIRQGVRLDPFNPILLKGECAFLHQLGRTDRALECYRRLTETHPLYLRGYVRWAQALFQTGQPDEARAVIDRAEEALSTPVGDSEAFAVLRAALGDSGPARRALAAIADETGHVAPARRARLHIALGNIDQAFEWLHREVDERGDGVLWCATGTACDPLRDDPRFAELLRRVHLEPHAY